MKELEFMELLSELPPEYIEAAAGPQKKQRGIIFRKLYGIPVIAACLVVIIAAAIYPRLRVAVPEQVSEPDQTTYTTTVAETVPYETEPAVTVTSSGDAAAVQTVTASQPAVTERTAAGGTRDTKPAQTTASGWNDVPAQQTEHSQAGAQHSGTAAKTTARSTAKTTAKATSKTTARPAAVTTRTTVRTTAAGVMTTKASARTTASPRVTTRPETRMTDPSVTIPQMIVTTAAPRYTTAPGAMMTSVAGVPGGQQGGKSSQTTEGQAVPQTTKGTGQGPANTDRTPDTTTAVHAMTTAAPAMTQSPVSSGGSGESPWRWWNTDWSTGGGSGFGDDSEQPPVKQVERIHVYQLLRPENEYEYEDGESCFALYDGADVLYLDEFSGITIPDDINPSNYQVLRVDYYGYFSDAAVTAAEQNRYDGVDVSVFILDSDNNFMHFTALLWIPKSASIAPEESSVRESVAWNPDYFYRELEESGNQLLMRL